VDAQNALEDRFWHFAAVARSANGSITSEADQRAAVPLTHMQAAD
jgi:hypothetical protein